MQTLSQHTVRLDPEDLEQCRRLAKQRRISVSALMSAFVREGLHNEGLHQVIVEQEFSRLWCEVELMKGLACAGIASSLQLGGQLLERNPGESDEAFSKRKNALIDTALQNAFRLGNQVFKIHEGSHQKKKRG